MYFLLPNPYIYCSFSLAGNIVAMTGHSKLTLLNSLFVSVANFLMNLVLIPLFGLVGAAIASAIATLSLHSLEVGEGRWIANAKLYLKDIYKPHTAGLVSVLLLGGGLIFIPWFSQGLFEQTILALIVVGTIALLLGEKNIRKLIKRLK